MKPGYTVGWSPSTINKLTHLWLENPAIQRDITSAVNELDSALSQMPGSIGIAAPGSIQARVVVRPPNSVLYVVSEEDRLVRVLDIKFWDE